MSRENFHRLLQRYMEERCTPEELQLVHHWYHMLDEQHRDEINETNLDVIEDALWNKIHREINHSPRHIWLRKWGWAASVALFLLVSGVFVYFRIICYPVQPSFSSSASLNEQVIAVENTTASAMRIILPDESLVELYPGAQLQYPKQFDTKDREVRLTGDAFFAVAASKENPFWVFHEGMITKVLGTKFKIKAPKGEDEGEVIVYSGKVDVFYNVGRNHFVKRLLATPEKASITTNQKAILKETTLQETVTENPLPVSERIADVLQETFNDIPMPELAHTLSDLYALKVVADDGLNGVTFTGDISGIGLFKQLDIICTVTSTQYEVIGTTILLKKK